jgi:hypothetical protein
MEKHPLKSIPLPGSDVRAADGRHNFLHENLMLGEPLYECSEENQMLRDAI